MLIVFEGIDGSGKGEQIARLVAYLKQARVKHRLRKYPTKKAKDALLHLQGKKDVPALELAGIFADDIASEQGKIAREADAGLVVVCDRYLHSTLAYQGAVAGYGKVKAELAKREVRPADVVFVLDIDERTSLLRKKKQKALDRFESDSAFMKKVRENYLREAKEGYLAYKCIVLDASKPADEVFSDIITQVEPVAVKKIEK